MADGLCLGDVHGDVASAGEGRKGLFCEKEDGSAVRGRSEAAALCVGNEKTLLDDMEATCDEEDYGKKRCVDRYDSSESSDSGVAVLSCTDCSGSSTASSDITDPGSPFSTGSNHSEDSSSQLPKMAPTQNSNHPPWPWSESESSSPVKPQVASSNTSSNGFSSPPMKRNSNGGIIQENSPVKRLKLEDDSSSTCLNNNIVQTPLVKLSVVNPLVPIPKEDSKKNIKKVEPLTKMQQGKITEYFKSQMKVNLIKKDSTVPLSKIEMKSTKVIDNVVKSVIKVVKGKKVEPKQSIGKKVVEHKPRTFASVVTHRKILPASETTPRNTSEKICIDGKNMKVSKVTTPRKILPAPSKTQTEKVNSSVAIQNLAAQFPQTVAFAFTPNLTYIHTKTPKPPDNLFIPQFTAISGDNLKTIPIVNRPCFNMIQPNVIQQLPKITPINCVKLNATVVPIVKLNPMGKPPTAAASLQTISLNIETGTPTVLSAKPKIDAHTSNIKAGNTTSISNNINSTPIVNTIKTTAASTMQATTNNTNPASVSLSDEDKRNPSPTNDSDSGISSNKDFLEISVSQKVQVEPQKSPILSQPKTIRFPAAEKQIKEQKTRQRLCESVLCQWDQCVSKFDTSGALLEHLQIKHVISQADQETYVCLWKGCKVHGRKSCSRTWLERHVLAHAGTKPFRCIVDGCGMRFNSQVSLERHVNGHFNSDGQQNSTSKKSVENNSSAKLFKRNGKKIRFRRQPWSARMFDFFDGGIMEGLQYQLLTMTEKRTMGQFEKCSGDTVTFKSQVLAKRIEKDGKNKFLVRWHPKDILPDEWLPEEEVKPTKEVPIPSLEPSAKEALRPLLFSPSSANYNGYPYRINEALEKPHKKHSRKPKQQQQQQQQQQLKKEET